MSWPITPLSLLKPTPGRIIPVMPSSMSTRTSLRLGSPSSGATGRIITCSGGAGGPLHVLLQPSVALLGGHLGVVELARGEIVFVQDPPDHLVLGGLVAGDIDAADAELAPLAHVERQHDEVVFHLGGEFHALANLGVHVPDLAVPLLDLAGVPVGLGLEVDARPPATSRSSRNCSVGEARVAGEDDLGDVIDGPFLDEERHVHPLAVGGELRFGLDLVVQVPLAVVEVAKPVDVLLDRLLGVVVRPEQPLLLFDLDDLPERPGAERVVADELDVADLDAGPFLDPVEQMPVGELVPVQRRP